MSMSRMSMRPTSALLITVQLRLRNRWINIMKSGREECGIHMETPGGFLHTKSQRNNGQRASDRFISLYPWQGTLPQRIFSQLLLLPVPAGGASYQVIPL